MLIFFWHLITLFLLYSKLDNNKIWINKFNRCFNPPLLVPSTSCWILRVITHQSTPDLAADCPAPWYFENTFTNLERNLWTHLLFTPVVTGASNLKSYWTGRLGYDYLNCPKLEYKSDVSHNFFKHAMSGVPAQLFPAASYKLPHNECKNPPVFFLKGIVYGRFMR